MTTEAIILAGGFGTRLKEVINDIPKPMAPINGRPFLEYLINYLKNNGIKSVILSIGYLGEKIKEHFGNEFSGVAIKYAIENEPLGTGGGIKLAFEHVEGNSAFVLNGDTLFDINLQQFSEFHSFNRAEISIALRKVDDVDRYGSVVTNSLNRIEKFMEKGQNVGQGYINGGTYLIDSTFFKGAELPLKFSMEKDVFEKFYLEREFYGYLNESYFLDIGIPEDYKKAAHDFKGFNY